MGLLARIARAAGGIALALSLLACANVPVVRAVPAREAERIVAVLATSGIAARTVRDEGAMNDSAFDVEVASEDVARALDALRAEELPHRDQPGATETYASSGLIPGYGEARAREAHALEGELARTLETWDGVLSARVHLSLRDPLSVPLDDSDGPRPSASVVLHVASGRAAPDEPAVRILVAGAVAGMTERDVHLVTVVRHIPPPTEPPFEWLGPFAVSKPTAIALRRVAIAALVLVAATALAVIVRRSRRIRRSPG